MGKAPKITPPPPPPPVPDEADAAPQAQIFRDRALAAIIGFRRSFLGGPRGPGGPDWQAPEVIDPEFKQDPNAVVIRPEAPPPKWKLGGGTTDSTDVLGIDSSGGGTLPRRRGR